MQDYNTIIGVIQMRQNECPFDVIQARYHIGSRTTQRILERFAASGTTLRPSKKKNLGFEEWGCRANGSFLCVEM